MSLRKNVKLAVSLLAIAVILGSCIKQGMTPDERQIFLPISSMSEYGANLPQQYAQYEKYTKQIYYDSTFELEYEYTPPESVPSDILYLSETYSFENRRSGVLVNDLVNKGLTTAIFKASGITLSEKADAFSWGSKSVAYDILAENKRIVGNRFIASSGKMLFTLTIIGMHIEEKELWAELLEQRLNRAKEFSIGFYSLKTK